MKMRWFTLALLAAAASPLSSSDLGKLPEWARPHAIAAQQEKAPEGADAWVLLDRTEIAYTGDGEFRMHRMKLVKVLGERGIAEGTFVLSSLGGSATKVKSLKGWNLREDGELVKLDPDTVVTVNADQGAAEVTTGLLTGAMIPRVAKESLVAFESLEVSKLPLGPENREWVMGNHPIRRWELEVAKREGWFSNLKSVLVQMDLRHFTPWIPNPDVQPGQRVSASNIPALPKDESAYPPSYNLLPFVLVKFLDPDLASSPTYKDWDSCATYYYGIAAPRIQPAKVVDTTGKAPAEALNAIYKWMAARLSYKQVYLSPERGWVPESGPEVVRRRYGDCKDLATCFLGEAKGLGFQVYPVLARINEGTPEVDDPVGLTTFNHVISAIRLEKSLGFTSEVVTPSGRFLLADPTDRLTPLGRLGSDHRGHRVLICTDKGGIWVAIPDSAILQPSTEVLLEGQADLTGRLIATMTFKETGDQLNLRGNALLTGRDKLREILFSELSLPPTAKLELVRSGDPLDLEHPFEVVVKVEHPDGFHRAGNEGTLVGWGLPSIPAAIQKIGQTRHFPVYSEAYGALDYTARLTMEQAVLPIVGEQRTETAFRTFTWNAQARKDQGKNLLELHFHQTRQPALFGFGDLEKGVAEAKRDRRAIQALRSDALSFKLLP